MKKIIISWVVCGLALGGLLLWLNHGGLLKNAGKGEATGIIQSDFTLQAADGKTVRAQDFRGRYMLVYFGFTHCPDMCPTSLLRIDNALKKLGKKANKLQPIFITLDPDRDSPKKVAAYVARFSKSVLGLGGTAAQIKDASDHFKVYYSKVAPQNAGADYAVDHSGFLYLMGPDGAYITHFAASISEQELYKELAAAID